MKINENTMREQYDGQYSTFCKKNSDYGNSFEESLDKHGIMASVVRIGDKMNRLEALTDESRTQQVGSESLLDTLEDLSNYSAMTACWLKGVRAEDEAEEAIAYGDDQPIVLLKKKEHSHDDSCPDMIDVIRYNVQDAKDTIEFRATEYIFKMLDDIYRVVQMKLEKDELLVPMDISDEAGLIAKCIVESGTRSESIPIIKDYLFDNYKNIPFEIREWIYGIIMRHLYYIIKEHNEKNEVEEFCEHLNDVLKSNASHITTKQDVDIRLISKKMNGIMTLLVPNVLVQRNPMYNVNHKLTQAKKRNEWYKQIANLILTTPGLSFDGFSGYVDTFAELTPDEKKLIKEDVATEIYSQTDKNPGGEEESEFRSKKFNIPPQEEEEKEPINEKMFKAFLWLFHPIIDINYRGDDND